MLGILAFWSRVSWSSSHISGISGRIWRVSGDIQGTSRRISMILGILRRGVFSGIGET